MPDNTVAISPDVIAPSTEETPPRKKQRLSSPQPTAKGKEPIVPTPKSNEPPAYKTTLGLKDSSSIRSDPSLTVSTMDCLMTRRDRSILKAMSLEDIEVNQLKVDAACKKKTAAYQSSAKTNKTLQATNKTLEADNLHLKQATTDANSRAEQAELKLLQVEKKWSETDQKLAEKNKELEAPVDFSHVAEGRATSSGLVTRKKKIIYRKGVEDAYLRAQKKMILKFKAGQTSWATPGEDDYDDDEASEISSGEDEPEQNNESPEDCTPAPEKSSSHEKDSFDEAMEAARTNTTGPSTNDKEVASASQPNQEEA
ncbi:hypothetical protein FNV43_RR16969 [Rhamnella rubrinervis]|uniref:Uncharacterized protein n=1 Tax=Rhamnella rubrinervis TaxID=2594499 RepID=A0A8K0ME97_9ROSA|nr:hypothetical protein FNV43_RR16969 [Rhamnella rubrinervis]